MPPPTKPPITLIVATNPIRHRPSASSPSHPTSPSQSHSNDSIRLGIGQNNTLPWPRIKADMSFFARVTSRPPTPGTTNAVIMGRKTYESVPSHLRPLAKRVNVVISRDTSGKVGEGIRGELVARKEKLAASAAAAAANANASTNEKKEQPKTDALISPSLPSALTTLNTYPDLGKVFVIGGAEIYGAALRLSPPELDGRPLRIVMTYVKRKASGGQEGEDGKGEEYECDTFFPVSRFNQETGWREVSGEEVEEWVGEKVESEWRDEGEVAIRMVGFERLD